MSVIKKVLHMTISPCAGAPGNLNDCLNKYSLYTSKVYCKRPVINIANFLIDYQDNLSESELQGAIDEANIIHFHNCTYEYFKRYDFTNKRLFFQLHSEPAVKGDILKKYREHCITLAQKHITLYKKPIPAVPNIFDIYEEIYTPGEKNKNKPIIFYSVTSVTKRSNYDDTCAGKGYDETNIILDRIKKEFGNKVVIKRFIKTEKRKVLEEKRKADVVIDECVTGGYHLTSLEGLSQGCVVINGLNDKVKKVIKDVSGCGDDIPFESCNIKQLYEVLTFLIKLWYEKNEAFRNLQKLSREWMENYWNPAKMVSHFEDIYDKYTETCSNPYEGLRYSSQLDRVRQDRNITKEQYCPDTNALKLPNLKSKLRVKNKPALILGMGPSVNRVDGIEDYLWNSTVFTCNYYFKKFGNIPVDFWCCIDAGVLKNAVNEIDKDAIVVANYPVTYTPFSNSRLWLQDNLDVLNKEFKTGIEIERPFTVATIMLMMAIYFDCNPIYITGVDLSLNKSDNNYCYSADCDKHYNSKFRPFTNNYRWIIKEFKKLKKEAEIRSIKVYNLDSESKNFNVFPIYKRS